MMNGIRTEVVVIPYADRTFVIVTQLKKLGTLVRFIISHPSIEYCTSNSITPRHPRHPRPSVPLDTFYLVCCTHRLPLCVCVSVNVSCTIDRSRGAAAHSYEKLVQSRSTKRGTQQSHALHQVGSSRQYTQVQQ